MKNKDKLLENYHFEIYRLPAYWWKAINNNVDIYKLLFFFSLFIHFPECWKYLEIFLLIHYVTVGVSPASVVSNLW